VAGSIPEETIARVLEGTDIVDLVGRYFPLKRAGRNFVALCPFHHEKTPSFHVSPDRQSFHCFGCGKGGTAIGFVMEMEKVPFPEAVELLADRCGIRIERSGAGSPEKRKHLFDIMLRAMRFFEKSLASEAGREASDYLARRGISAESIKAFHLGYSPPGWDGLLREARSAGIEPATLASAGLIISREGGGFYDRFRNRLMFPIWNNQEKVVGFGARSLDPAESAKYINSPETPLFSKGKLLYGLNLAKNEIIRSGCVVVVEGYTDVIMAHQHGIANVVATLGTALGREHVRLLKRYARRCTLVYDGDAAGQKASDSSLEVFVEEEMDTAVATLPEGKDPCDCLVESGPGVFSECLAGAVGMFEFKLRAAKAAAPLDAKRVAAIADDVLRLVARIPNVIERGMQLDAVALLIARELGVPEASARRRFAELAASGRGRPDRPETPAERQPLPPMERELLCVCLQAPELFAELAKESAADDYSHRDLRAIFEAGIGALDGEGRLELARLHARLADTPAAEVLAELVNDTEGASDYRGRFDGCLGRFKAERTRRSRLEIRKQLLAAGREGNQEAVERLEQEYLGKYSIRGGPDGQA